MGPPKKGRVDTGAASDHRSTCKPQPEQEQPEKSFDNNTDAAWVRAPATETAANVQPSAVFEGSEELSRVVSAPYTVFSRRARVGITVMVSFASMVSPMTSNIYFPALDSVASDLGVSLSLINLTLTTYMIFQGVAPTLLGDFGDKAGRRPAYTLSFLVFLGANIGLALQRDYAVLMVLRCVQAAGSSGTLALGYGVVADLAPRSTRGKYMGYLGAAINVGPTLGPFLGGVLSETLGWPSIFWFLAIFVTAFLIPWVLFAPETGRNVVGNGCYAAQKWNRPLAPCSRVRRQKEEMPASQRPKLSIPNPLGTLVMVFEKEMGSILLIAAVIYLCFILVAATMGTLLKEIYNYNDLEVGLCYLPYGLGCCVTSIAQGYAQNWNYRRIARQVGFDLKSKENGEKFPIEKARLELIYPSMLVGAAALIGYGWALQAETSIAVPLVMVFIIGMMIPTSLNMITTLMVDLFPEAPASAAAANNLVRCLFGAAATAVIDYMLNGMGRGWCFTFLAFLMVACVPWVLFIQKVGPRWRAEKRRRQEQKKLHESL
ncbi:Major facilitator superfamily transporter [Akanthomyces lecanii RCEF 1005]|uniref:Major facilitator superfamily transporter n=1 Tax=Akanthomyces lecanii RCEF 1005 TaxID=1081108 RepID=A0A168K172_CORDF|nr:Major facilitator superfamily transporter [Akanthomyces lecanii RCEF 1005]